ncbi:MAG: hypothetical protein GQ564_12890 [Bacteroidales bacterium]|nr:hypothetical protein [Bacteroidales bacterium]
MENRLFKTFIYILWRLQIFADKYLSVSDIGSCLSLLLIPFSLNVISLTVFIEHLLSREFEDYKNTLITIIIAFVIIDLGIVIYLDNKDKYYNLLRKLKKDTVFCNVLEKRKRLIDSILIANSVLWIFILVATNNLFWK